MANLDNRDASRLIGETPMIDEPDIFRAAQLLIEKHGGGAALRAAQHGGGKGTAARPAR
jgi:hypothetical protein